ncbi:MAG TPA: hypothetical protein PLD14_00945 [Candidatus Pacearchaeota archaeon]|nr:hypothetical protein [Candidatus Pacearchaeota archaeon]HPR79766.1 hypothetical protein [Candidatus Pacearchaeota archaeon]
MLNILPFVEELVDKYELEKDIIENDEILKNKLSGVNDYSERVFIKFLYSDELKNSIINDIPLNTPFAKIKKIIDGLINKKIDKDNLSLTLQKELVISPEISEKISEDILGNEDIMNEVIAVKIIENEEEGEDGQKIEPKKTTKSIGYELLK